MLSIVVEAIWPNSECQTSVTSVWWVPK